MPLYAGMPWNELEVLDGVARRCRCGGARRGRACASARCRGSDVPIYFLEYNRYFDRPYLYGPPAEGYPDNLERFTFLSRGSLELCKALGFIPDVIHCNDWQTALVPVYVNTVEWAQPLHGSGDRLHDPQPRLPGRVRRRRACSSPASAASTTTPASSSTSAR